MKSLILKKLNTSERFRFNLIFLLLVWLSVLIPLWMPNYSLSLSSKIVIIFLGLINLVWTVALLLSARFVWKLSKKQKSFQTNHSIITFSRLGELHHIVTICIYKEPLELIEKTLESLRQQTQSHRIIVVVAMEERTPQVSWKEQVLKMKFEKDFERLFFTIHPFGIPGEIPGKCSNVNYGLRTSVRRLEEEGDLQIERTTVTTCDADNIFHPKYFEELGKEFLSTRRNNQVVWQSPLFYNWQLDSSPWFTRVVGLLRPVFMMGLLIPFNINTMSVQSLSLELCIKGDYFHPRYQMDDIIAVIRWMTEIRREIEIRPIYVPTLSGPTSGNSLSEEFREWRVQIRRWTIGAAEVFHYYCVRFFSLPLNTGISWGAYFIAYYCIFLCAAPLVGLVGGLKPIIYPESTSILVFSDYSFSSLLITMGTYQLFCFLNVFFLNYFWVKILGLKERVSNLRNILHFLLTPVTVIAFSLVAFTALHEMAIGGKSVCVHIPSKKNALAKRLYSCR
ncbi:MAG: hypothetical protein QNJ32_09060 [Xenococcaceae cyanobacterium MO_167.B27]|nr:hypothetical protein [Xenococcaceae cyanobacterium MO_167.B27]